jgi:hypothetical protein
MLIVSARRRRSKVLGRALMVRAQEPLVAQIDGWIARNDPTMTRAECIRHLARLGLAVSGKSGSLRRGIMKGLEKKRAARGSDPAKMRLWQGEVHLGQDAT